MQIAPSEVLQKHRSLNINLKIINSRIVTKRAIRVNNRKVYLNQQEFYLHG